MKFRKKCFLSILILLILISMYGFFIEPDWVSVTKLEIPLPTGWEVLDGSLAIQLSDLHIKKIGGREQKVLKIVKRLKPEFTLLTGDYVGWKGDYAPALTFMARLKAQVGTWAVMGDYDYSDSRRSCLFCHEEGTGKPAAIPHLNFLRNRIIDLPYRGGKIKLGGIDPEGYGYKELAKKLPGLKSVGPLILLSHSPLVFDTLSERSSLLVLSGDTHGGQVILPRWFYRVTGYVKNVRYNQGFFKKERKMMCVSRGLGTSHIPVRILRKPEVVVIRFGASRGEKKDLVH